MKWIKGINFFPQKCSIETKNAAKASLKKQSKWDPHLKVMKLSAAKDSERTIFNIVYYFVKIYAELLKLQANYRSSLS